MTKTIRSERKINTPRSTDFIVFFYMKNFGQLIELNVKCYFLAFLLTHSSSVFLNFYPVPSSLWSEIRFYFSVLIRIKQLDSSFSNESLEQKTGTNENLSEKCYSWWKGLQGLTVCSIEDGRSSIAEVAGQSSLDGSPRIGWMSPLLASVSVVLHYPHYCWFTRPPLWALWATTMRDGALSFSSLFLALRKHEWPATPSRMTNDATPYPIDLI